jgi:RNA ligase (TIGR02306 family)
VVRTEDWAGKDKAIYIPVDSIVPDKPIFEFLGDRRRIRAIRLRGIYSEGLFIPAEDHHQIGQDVTQEVGIVKYEPPETSVGGLETVIPPRGSGTTTKYDIESIKRYPDILQPDEPVVVTEKLHGQNGRYVFQEPFGLYCGSRTSWLKDGPHSWAEVAKKERLADKLSNAPDLIFYGEVFGWVQKMKYGSKPGEYQFRVFDIFDIAAGEYLDHGEAKGVCTILGIETVPVIFEGGWPGVEAAKPWADGKSALADHYREGYVVKPLRERYDDRLGRVILKLHGEEYSLKN